MRPTRLLALIVPIAIAVTGLPGLPAQGVDKEPKRIWTYQVTDSTGATLVRSISSGALSAWTPRGRARSTVITGTQGKYLIVASTDPAVTFKIRQWRVDSGPLDVVAQGPDVSEIAIDLVAEPGARYLGLGERSDRIDHRGRAVLNRVLDGPYTTSQQSIVSSLVPPPGFSKRADATYFPMAWVLSTSGYGLSLSGYEDSVFELATRKHPKVNRLRVRSDRLNLDVVPGPKPRDVLRHAGSRQPVRVLDPAAYGVWWQPTGDVAAQLDEQQAAGVPISVAQTYTHYLPCGDQESARERALTSAMHTRGVAVTTYVNPMVCTNLGDRYDRGVAAGAFTKGPDGQPLVYRYSTASNFQVAQIDFSALAGRALFDEVLTEVVADGYDGWMEDFGEYTPDHAVSADGTPGATMHNRYVHQYHDTAWRFAARTNKGLLRFNRSGWKGTAGVSSIVWGGDPTVTWGFDGLESSVIQGLSMGLSGVSMWGPDIGGFFQWLDSKPSTELLNRWIQYGAFTGVMRLQSGGINISGKPRVLVTDPAVAPVWRRYARLRTMLYPYISGSQEQYAKTGLPLMRHLSLVDPGDPASVNTDDAYLFGDSLLVAPVVKPAVRSRSVHLPRGQWVEVSRAWNLRGDGRLGWRPVRVRNGRTDVTAKAPVDTTPLFQRVGSVIPMLPRTVDTLSSYGTGASSLAGAGTTRTLIALPAPGRWKGTLGPHKEKITSVASKNQWVLKLDTSGTYTVKASLAALPAEFRACRVNVGGVRQAVRTDTQRRLTFTVRAGGKQAIVVERCR